MKRLKICPTGPWSHFYNLPLLQTALIQTINLVIISQQFYLAIICCICSFFLFSLWLPKYIPHFLSFGLLPSKGLLRSLPSQSLGIKDPPQHSSAHHFSLSFNCTLQSLSPFDLLSLHYFRLLPWPRTPFLLTKISWSLNQAQISVTTPSTPGHFQRKRLPWVSALHTSNLRWKF